MSEQVKLLLDLRALRIEAGLSVERVAALTGIGRSTLDRMEAGESMNLANALRLAHFLRMPIEEIWALGDETTGTKGTRN